MEKDTLQNYARLIAVMGANIQEGQDCVISAELDQPEFVTILAEECYRAGAAQVTVEWMHQPSPKSTRLIRARKGLVGWRIGRRKNSSIVGIPYPP